MQLSGGLWLPASPSPLQLSNIIINLFFACFYILSAYFCSASPAFPPPSSFSTLKFITSNLPISSTVTRTCAHTHARARGRALEASRPRELPRRIMTDNWLFWVQPRQHEPITMTATSPRPACTSVCVRASVCLCVLNTNSVLVCCVLPLNPSQ